MLWFTADEHYGHTNIIKYCSRPFSSVEEMNEKLINNHNSVVSDKDVVWHVGDFTLSGSHFAFTIQRRLHGKHFYINGSHDRWIEEASVPAPYLKELMYEGQRIVLCHYAFRVWPHSHHGSWQMYGHTHGKLPGIGYQWDVGVDNNNFLPISFDQLKEKFSRTDVPYTIYTHHGDKS